MDWAARIAELMWGAGLAAVPVAIVAAVCCRMKMFRPATRHAMWFAVLFTLLSPIVMAGIWRPAWFRSDRVMSAVDAIAAAPVEKAPAKARDVMPEAWLDERPQPPRDPSLFVRAVEPLREKVIDAAAPLAVSSQPESMIPATVKPAESPSTVRPALVGLEKALLTPVPRLDAPREEARAKPAPAMKTKNATREWLTQVLAARDALAAVPTIPPAVWFGGASLLVSFWVARYVLIRRLIRRAEPAPASMVAMVRRLATVAGVKRVPETLVVDDRVSPMIWCGLQPRLIIPRALWGELDTKCQCAVIVHELCHLRRRDHRMCWVESLIGLAYWWHPVSWWARRRLRDEAEACCDAWVTTLLPGGRRAYAEALVATKSFLSVPGRSGAPGLGVSGRTRQLARRVTMVMTQRVAPRASVFGLAFAIAIAATGMLVMPGLACPPEEAKAKQEAAKVRAAALSAEKKARDEARAKDGVLFLGEAPALEAMKKAEKSKAAKGAADDALQERVRVLRDKERALQDMEKRLREMEIKLERLQEQGQRPRGATNLAPTPRAIAGVPGQPGLAGRPGAVTVGPMAPRAVTGQLASPRVLVPGEGATVMTLPRGAVTLQGVPQARVSRPATGVGMAQSGETIARAYALPDGKLEALTNLMIRDDVPILVSRDGGKITIHATQRQHEIIGAFIKIINPDGKNPEGHSSAPMGLQGYTVVTGEDAKRYSADLKAAAKALEAQKKDSQNQYKTLMRQLERTREQTQKLREHHENARGEHEEDGVDESSDPFMIQLEGLEGRIEELDGLSERIDCQIEALECTIECLKEQAENPVEVTLPEVPEVPEPPAAPEAPHAATAPTAPVAPAAALPPSAPAAPAAALPPTPPAPSAAPAAPAAPAGAAPAAPAVPPVPPSELATR